MHVVGWLMVAGQQATLLGVSELRLIFAVDEVTVAAVVAAVVSVSIVVIVAGVLGGHYWQ